MSLSIVIFLGLIGWMLFMHMRPGGHGGGHRGSEDSKRPGGEDGTA